MPCQFNMSKLSYVKMWRCMEDDIMRGFILNTTEIVPCWRAHAASIKTQTSIAGLSFYFSVQIKINLFPIAGGSSAKNPQCIGLALSLT